MAEVDTIDIPDVTPTTRTVATMSKLIKTVGLPTDAAAAQTDATSVTQTSILKQLSAYLLILSGAVGSSKVATKAAAADFADGSIATLGLKADAKSTATDTTAITLMQVAKQISASVQALNTALGSITNTTNALDINVKSGGTPVGTGADSTGALVTFTTEGKASVGALTETAPATDTASSGLNGRLQRIAQNITTLIAATLKTVMSITATANGGTASRINAAASTNATNLKASAGQLYTIDVFNPAAYNVFLKLYNKASAPTVGTDTPVMTIPIQAGGGYSKTWPMGLPFATGISYAITKLQADSDTTVVVAGDLTGNMLWI